MNRFLIFAFMFCFWSFSVSAEEAERAIDHYEPMKVPELFEICQKALKETETEAELQQTRCGTYVEGVMVGEVSGLASMSYFIAYLNTLDNGKADFNFEGYRLKRINECRGNIKVRKLREEVKQIVNFLNNSKEEPNWSLISLEEIFLGLRFEWLKECNEKVE